MKTGLRTPTQEFFFNPQLWQVTVLQPFELRWWKVAHMKAPSHIYWHLTWKQHNSTFIICQDVLESANLLHKWGLNDSQSNNPVIVHWIHQQSMKFQNCNHKSSWFSSLFLLDRQRNNDKDIINSTKYVMNHSWLSTVVSNLSCLICFFYLIFCYLCDDINLYLFGCRELWAGPNWVEEI